MKIRAIILDFDGVVIESNRIKHEAFSEIFSEYPEHYERMMAYHLARNHVDRHKKFKYFITEVLGQPFDQALADKLAQRFAKLTREKIINSSYVEGALDLIREFAAQIPLYIASATPLDELMIILEARQLTPYFKGIYGAPKPKQEMFALIMQQEGIGPKDLLFIGDSPEDHEVAKSSGINFVGRVSDTKFNDPSVKSFKDVSEIKAYLSKECVLA
ncbi:MAG: HAD family hydrolase [Pseudomonadota bacterium]